jgi:hypothetical protein
MRLNFDVEEAYGLDARSPSSDRSDKQATVNASLIEEPVTSVCARFGKSNAANRHCEDEIIGGAYSHA